MKRIILIIILILLLVSILIHLTKMYVGYYSTLKIQGIDKENKIEKIYKSKDDYLIVTDDKKVYLAKLSIDLKMFKIYQEVTSKIGQFNDIEGSFQLKDGVVVFYNSNKKQDDLIEFKFFSINDNKIVKKAKNTIKIASRNYTVNYYDLENGDFLINFRGENNKGHIERYTSKDNAFKELKANSLLLFQYNTTVKLNEDNFLITNKRGENKKAQNQTYLIDAYMFNAKTNEIKSKSIQIKEMPDGAIDFQIIPFNSSFLVFQYLYSLRKNMVTYFDIDDLNPKQYKTIELDFPDYSLAASNIIQLNNNEFLISGGIKSSFMAYGAHKDSYIYNAKTDKIAKTFKMKEPCTSSAAVVVNKKSAVRYGKSSNVYLFRKGIKVW